MLIIIFYITEGEIIKCLLYKYALEYIETLFIYMYCLVLLYTCITTHKILVFEKTDTTQMFLFVSVSIKNWPPATETYGRDV